MLTVSNTEERQRRARRKAREVNPIMATAVTGSYRVEGSGGNCNCMAGQDDKRESRAGKR